MSTIKEHVNETPHYYKVYFTNGKERTAGLVVCTTDFPFGETSIYDYSRLFPVYEASKMTHLVTNWPVDTFEEAFLQ